MTTPIPPVSVPSRNQMPWQPSPEMVEQGAKALFRYEVAALDMPDPPDPVNPAEYIAALLVSAQVVLDAVASNVDTLLAQAEHRGYAQALMDVADEKFAAQMRADARAEQETAGG